MELTTRLKKNLLDSLDSAVLALNKQFQIIYMNQSAEILLSHSLQRVVGVCIDQLIHNDAFHQQLAFASRQDEAHAVREQVIKRTDDQTITVDCIITPLANMEGFPDGCLLLEIHALDRQLRIVREEYLSNQQQAIHEMVRGMAHEIRNPLGGLRGAAQLLEAELDNPKFIEYVHIIMSEADRLTELVNDLLGPRRLPKREWVNIHEVLEHVCQLVHIEGSKAIRFKRDYDPSIPEFQCDRGHLVQICLNILNNAMHAVSSQGLIALKTRIMRQFTIRQHCYRLVLCVEICDNGEGIPSHLQDKIFLPMVSGHSGGSGLGLPIAQSLLAQYNGVIQCQSKPGQTCFSIRIPLPETRS